MTRSAAARISATADALLDWLHSQQRALSTGSQTPADAAGPAEASAEPAPAVDTSPSIRPRRDDRARAAPTASRRQEADAARAAPLRLDHTDWLHHRLTITGPDAVLTAFRQAAAGAGIIPWRLDLDRIEEDMFNFLVAPPRQPRTLSVAGAGIVVGQLREAVSRRHDLAVARVGTSRACPFDLHALLPVPAAAVRQRRHDRLALRCQPALPAVAQHPRGDHQLLHLVRLVALNCEPGGTVTRSTSVSGTTRGVTLPRLRRLARLPLGFAAVAFSMPLGLIDGRPFKPFRRAISSRWAATTCFSSRTSPSSATNWAFSSARGRPGRSVGGGMSPPNRTAPRRGKPENHRRPGFCPGYLLKG